MSSSKPAERPASLRHVTEPENGRYSEGPLPEAVAWSVTAYLLSGPLLYGGIGYALDYWLGTSFLVLIGILAGMALSLYMVWFRYGTS